MLVNGGSNGRTRRRLDFVRKYGGWRRGARELWRFKWRENRERQMVGSYHTRRLRIPYAIRHTTGDVGVFVEVFVQGEYEPPPAVTRRLDALGRPPRVLDLGANIGLFSTFARDRWPGAKVVALEPDPNNLEILRQAAAERTDLEVVAACAGPSEGVVRFAAGEFQVSHVAANGEAGTIEVPCVDAFPFIEAADLVKMDIEGSEWPILADPRLRSVHPEAWVIEWHAGACPQPDARATARTALERAGYEIVSERFHEVDDNATIWAVRL